MLVLGVFVAVLTGACSSHRSDPAIDTLSANANVVIAQALKAEAKAIVHVAYSITQSSSGEAGATGAGTLDFANGTGNVTLNIRTGGHTEIRSGRGSVRIKSYNDVAEQRSGVWQDVGKLLLEQSLRWSPSNQDDPSILFCTPFVLSVIANSLRSATAVGGSTANPTYTLQLNQFAAPNQVGLPRPSLEVTVNTNGIRQIHIAYPLSDSASSGGASQAQTSIQADVIRIQMNLSQG